MSAVAASGASSDLTRDATAALREMIVRRQLAPGAQIRQVELAERLGLSRSPLRQALSALETELLRTARPPAAPELEELAARNADVQAALDDASVTAMLVVNRAFHFGLFELSPLGAIRADVERLWNASEPYRATYLWLPTTRRRIVREHAQMLDALARGDRARLVQVANRHRDAAREVVTDLLAVEAL